MHIVTAETRLFLTLYKMGMSRISVVSSYAIRNPKSAERKDVSYAYFI